MGPGGIRYATAKALLFADAATRTDKVKWEPGDAYRMADMIKLVCASQSRALTA